MWFNLPENTKYLLILILLVSVLLLWTNQSATAPTEHHIDLNASQFDYSPGRLEVNQGDKIVITLRAEDVVHGFYLDGYGIQTRIRPGVAQQIEFTANYAGKFRYRCSVSCGVLHPFMIGELVVRPNNPFWKSILISLIALGGLLFFLWRSTEKRTI